MEKRIMDLFKKKGTGAVQPVCIYDEVLEAAQKDGLPKVLENRMRDCWIDAQSAPGIAQNIMEIVAAHMYVQDAVLSEEAGAMFDQFLENLAKDTPETNQKIILYKLYFGLTAHQDPEIIKQLEQGVSSEELFWRDYAKKTAPPASPKTVEELKEQVRNAMNTFDLPPQAMKALIQKMEISGDWLATAEALGQNGFNYKCILTAELYRNGAGSMTVEEAASVACAGVETQAVTASVASGILLNEAAKKILIAAAIAAVVVGVGLLVCNTGAVLAAPQTASAMAATANAATWVEELPAVFAPFATTSTAAGAPAILRSGWVPAETVAKWTADLVRQAHIGQIIGLVVAVSGAAMATLSKKAAEQIGRLGVVLPTRDKTSFVTDFIGFSDSIEDRRRTASGQFPQEDWNEDLDESVEDASIV